jgi:hypothetical protein
MPARSLVLPKRTAHLSRTAAAVGAGQHLRRWAPFLFVVGGGVLAILPAMLQGIPNNYDLQHHYHFAVPFYEALGAGNIVPGWLAESNYGFGDPVFRFYPPAFYYLIAATRAVAGGWYAASLVALTIVSVLGAYGAYFAARSYVGPRDATVAGVFYAFMPYHVSEVYQAALLAEFAGGAALLFAFAFVKRVSERGSRHNVVGLSIAYALLLLTHLPLAVMGSIALFVYAVFSVKVENLGSTILRLMVSVLISLGLTAFYWSRMVFELGWIRSDGSHPNPLLDYRLNFLLSSFSPDQNLTLWWMNVLLAATVVMLLPALILFHRQTRNRNTIGLFVVLLFSIFMATPLSKPLWVLLTPLQRAQHPFRWLGVISAVVPILLAMATSSWVQIAKTKMRPFALLAIGALAIPLAFTAGQTIRDANYLSRAAFDEMIQSVTSGPSINAWLPKWADRASNGGAADDKCLPPEIPQARVEAGDRSVKIELWSSENRRFAIGPGKEGFASVRTFYYPHWHARSNDRELTTSADRNGSLTIALPPETTSVDLALVEPVRSKVGAGVSVVGWLGCLILLIPLYRRGGR